jgi:sugar lactone lactonase YvrE
MITVSRLDERLPLNNLGEGACWDEGLQTLWWVDTNENLIHRYDMAAKIHAEVATGLPVSFVFPDVNGSVLAGLADGLYRIDAETAEQTLIAPLHLPEDHRLNDGKLDPVGRLWVGTINSAPQPSASAALYRVGPDGFEEIEGGYTNANGKVWSLDAKIMYHADTSRGTIWQYDYDVDSGMLSNRRVFVHVPDGHPDGLAIDREGTVFAAMYGGSHVAAFDVRGNESFRIDLPVPNPTSCAFGGEGLKRLFITTAFDGMSDEAIAEAPLSGSIFVVDLEVGGAAQTSRIGAEYSPRNRPLAR